MKRLFFILIAALMTASVWAEYYPTKFLGIPIEGSKEEMMRKIQAKGFTYHKEYGQEYLSGEFNGSDVDIHIATNNNKVYRVMVCEQKTCSEGQIRIRFNNLMKQFNDNSKYLSGDIDQDYIPESEDISYEMTVHNKTYSAYYLQNTHLVDTILLERDSKEILFELTSQLSSEDIMKNKELLSAMAFFKAAQKQYLKNKVWFTISEFRGGYFLVIYYDNEYNKANGEDL